MTNQESFSWIAVLKNGNIVRMGDVDEASKQEISSSILNPEEVVMVRLYPLQYDGAPIEVKINVQKGERFIRFWRNIVLVDQTFRLNIVGIRIPNGEEYRLYVFPDGKTVLSSDDLYESLLKE